MTCGLMILAVALVDGVRIVRMDFWRPCKSLRYLRIEAFVYCYRDLDPTLLPSSVLGSLSQGFSITCPSHYPHRASVQAAL